jgi:hypothetical protein
VCEDDDEGDFHSWNDEDYYTIPASLEVTG